MQCQLLLYNALLNRFDIWLWFCPQSFDFLLGNQSLARSRIFLLYQNVSLASG
jgi:hypothetical protein